MKNKKIFIEIPTWLGDAVMTTPAVDNICKIFPDCELTIFGSFVSTTIFKNHPNVKKIIIDNSKSNGNRYINLFKLAKSANEIDISFSFRKNFTSKFLLFFLNSSEKFIYKRYSKEEIHQVIRYNDFINYSLKKNTNPGDLSISLVQNDESINKKLILGINPGATYGSAKRWYPEEFAKVCIELSSRYNIKIFGGPNEKDIAKDIEKILIENNIKNYENIAGLTSVDELLVNISNLDLFITNDSGPMHVAAAFKVPTISIFGPTKFVETSQWNNKNSKIVKKDFECMPCMKRECHLSGKEEHQCMKMISANDVLIAIKEIDDNRI